MQEQRIAEQVIIVEMIPNFQKKHLNGNEPARCVDGRPSNESDQGPQMLGGTLHPIVLSVIFHNTELNNTTIRENALQLKQNDINTGAHRGSHQHESSSDCGFADRLKDILKKAVEARALISKRLHKIYEDNKDILEPLGLPPFNQLLETAYDKIASYEANKIEITGEKLISAIEDTQAPTETVEGSHNEQVAFINLKRDTTLDTNGLNAQGCQAFNLDLMHAIDHAKLLGIPEEFSVPASLILYMATEVVLVEEKGKPALRVKIHS